MKLILKLSLWIGGLKALSRRRRKLIVKPAQLAGELQVWVYEIINTKKGRWRRSRCLRKCCECVRERKTTTGQSGLTEPAVQQELQHKTSAKEWKEDHRVSVSLFKQTVTRDHYLVVMATDLVLIHSLVKVNGVWNAKDIVDAETPMLVFGISNFKWPWILIARPPPPPLLLTIDSQSANLSTWHSDECDEQGGRKAPRHFFFFTPSTTSPPLSHTNVLPKFICLDSKKVVLMTTANADVLWHWCDWFVRQSEKHYDILGVWVVVNFHGLINCNRSISRSTN